MTFDKTDHTRRMQWFTEARFGLFIHWGAYAIPARGEWVKSRERLTNEAYQVYVDEFNPTAYDPRAWARLAKEAGMKYAVMTAKHHDGYCLFDSALTEYKYKGRDLLREYAEAFRAEGIKVGFYFSIIDWYHPHYPHFHDAHHPRRGDPSYAGHTYDFDIYLDYMFGQVRELCTHYGKIDIMWFDFSYGDMSGEKWRAAELVKMVRTLQPDIIIDNRLEDLADTTFKSGNPEYYAGDFLCPEQLIPPAGMFDDNGIPVPWEACITMNDNWGYAARDKNFKPAPMLIRKLVECVSKGGNLLLNIGPDATGRIPAESVKILQSIGAWMAKNSDSIYGCGYANRPKPDFGRITAKDNRLFFHIMENTVGPLPITGISPDEIKKIRLAADGSELFINNDWRTQYYDDITFVDVSDKPDIPDVTVIEVTLK